VHSTRYAFAGTRVARFLGRKPGEEADGLSDGAPDDDSLSARCLEPVGEVEPTAEADGPERGGLTPPPLGSTMLRRGRR
jgi:hypothetical protein